MSENEKNTKVYTCSGCADVGEIADQIGRKLRRDGFASAKTSCIVGIGAGLAPFIEAAKNADRVIAVDGCEVACARRLIEKIGVEPQTVILTQLGLEKGKTRPSPELTNNLCQKIVEQFKQ